MGFGFVEVAVDESVSPLSQGKLIFVHFFVQLRIEFLKLSGDMVNYQAYERLQHQYSHCCHGHPRRCAPTHDTALYGSPCNS